MNRHWHDADREQMLQYISDLREQLTVVTALLEDRDSEFNRSTDISRKRIADAEALIARRPKQEAEAVS